MRRVAQHYDAEVGETGLKGTQYALLSCVIKLGPVRPGDLARALKVDASILSRTSSLWRLLAAGCWLAGAGLGQGQGQAQPLGQHHQHGRKKMSTPSWPIPTWPNLPEFRARCTGDSKLRAESVAARWMSVNE